MCIVHCELFCNFVVSTTPCRSLEKTVEGWGGLHIEKVFANALFLELLNLRNSSTQIKNMAEVGTTGRYIADPVGVQRTDCPHAYLTGRIYTDGVGVISVCLFVRLFAGPNSSDGQRQDAPLFLCVVQCIKTRPNLGI